ncbi:MAG: hypothetical protein HN730_03585 [Bdellovibrionales bacterium]|nr:hypothetical protein [Bdellovibrionales bacterium]
MQIFDHYIFTTIKLSCWLLFLLTNKVVATTESGTNYLRDVRPIFEQRCVACHSCYDSPCTLKLTSYQGLSRGGSNYDIYGNRITSIPYLRLGQDAKTVVQWRDLGFWSVVPEQNFSAKKVGAEQTLLYHLVSLGAKKNINGTIKNLEQRPPEKCLKSVDDWRQTDRYIADHLGMPFGLPPLTASQLNTLKNWVESGALGPSFAEKQKEHYSHAPKSVDRWEAFFNGPERKHQWSAKYLYEHLYLAHFHFPREIGRGKEEFYRLVRSKTPAPHRVEEIVTKLPFDPPHEIFFYRFVKITSTLVHKTHIVYLASPQKLQQLKKLFWERPWQQKKLVALNWDSRNPFINFRPIPPRIRYQWMLNNAKLLVDLFTRGPVCNGSIATYAVRDFFWVFFADPNGPLAMTEPSVLDQLAPLLDLPTLNEDQLFHLQQNQVENYEERHANYLKSMHQGRGVGVSDIWRGDRSSVLTIFRHGMSVSVHSGAIGVEMPHTYWLLDYPIFERIYYSLVATFNVFGSMDHKVATRIYMENLRREGEDNFLLFLPPALRVAGRGDWYQNTNLLGIKQQDERPFYLKGVNSQLKIKADNGPLAVTKLAQKMVQQTAIKSDGYVAKIPLELQKINQVAGSFNRFFRDVSVVRFKGKNKPDRYFTLISHRYHKTMNVLFLEERTRESSLDKLSIIPDLLLSYPNILFNLDEKNLSEFVGRVRGISNWLEYERLERDFGVRKSDPSFWEHYDQMGEYFLKQNPIEYGVIDLNRYQLPRGVETKVAQLWQKGRENSLKFYRDKSRQAKEYLKRRQSKAKNYLDVQHASVEKFWQQKVKQINLMTKEMVKKIKNVE